MKYLDLGEMKLADLLEIWLRLKLDRILVWAEGKAEQLHKWGKARR